MADLLINPHRHQYNIQKKQANEKKAASQSPENAQADALKNALQKRMDSYKSLVEKLEEDNRKQLLKVQWKEEEKRPPAEEIEMKIQRMRSKLRGGGRLTSGEKAYLARYAPGELQKLLQVEAERAAFRARLESCKTKESVNQAYQGACSSAMGADTAEDPDLSSVMIGQFAAALREVSHKPTEAQLEQQDPRQQMRLDAKA